MLEKDNVEYNFPDVDVEFLLEFTPGYIFWKNLDSVYLGCNQNFAHLIGLKNNQEIIGKSEYDMPWGLLNPETVTHNMAADQEVINTGHIAVTEEDVGIKKFNGLSIILRSEKRPLRNKKGNIVGVLGVSVDITDQKEAERLRLEEKEKLLILAHKVAHDISSPLSALSMMMRFCNELPENKRSIIQKASESILDIANNLLNTYRNDEDHPLSGSEQRQPILIADLIVHLLSEKKVQYHNCSITFITDIVDNAHFAFALLQPTELRRTLSNLINNAVEALPKEQKGLITVELNANDEHIVITVNDNGCGMNSATMAKINQRRRFTEGKEKGHGLGLQQVWDTLDHNQGILQVQSKPGEGTKIELTFPRIEASSWIAQEIYLDADNIIVILDDDVSIHTAWDLRFWPLFNLHPTLEVHHFRQGQEALDFLANLNQAQKDRVIFLSDYELLSQKMNGLKVIKASGIKQAILVTSYYSNLKVREEIDALDLGIKILPKHMASIIPIMVS